MAVVIDGKGTVTNLLDGLRSGRGRLLIDLDGQRWTLLIECRWQIGHADAVIADADDDLADLARTVPELTVEFTDGRHLRTLPAPVEDDAETWQLFLPGLQVLVAGPGPYLELCRSDQP